MGALFLLGKDRKIFIRTRTSLQPLIFNLDWADMIWPISYGPYPKTFLSRGVQLRGNIFWMVENKRNWCRLPFLDNAILVIGMWFHESSSQKSRNLVYGRYGYLAVVFRREKFRWFRNLFKNLPEEIIFAVKIIYDSAKMKLAFIQSIQGIPSW